MGRPAVQRVRFLWQVRRAVIDARYARLVAADVVQHGFDDVRLYPDFGHAGGHGADVVQAPRKHLAVRFLYTFVKPFLGLRPTRESAIPEAKNQIAILDTSSL